MSRAKQGKARSVRNKGGRGRSSKFVVTSSRHGFDGSVSPPMRQTASVLRQPVTIVSTSYPDTTSAPPSELRRTTGRQTKPFQLFCVKRLQSHRPMLLRNPLDATDVVAEKVSLIPKLRPVGPGIDEQVACLSVACSVQNVVAGMPITGQTGPKKAIDQNPNININPDQPLIQAVMISEQDVLAQEQRVLDARRRLEEALKHFG